MLAQIEQDFLKGVSTVWSKYILHESLSLHDVIFFKKVGRRLSGVSFVTRLELHLYTVLTTQKAEENNCSIPNAQDTTALQVKVF